MSDAEGDAEDAVAEVNGDAEPEIGCDRDVCVGGGGEGDVVGGGADVLV